MYKQFFNKNKKFYFEEGAFNIKTGQWDNKKYIENEINDLKSELIMQKSNLDYISDPRKDNYSRQKIKDQKQWIIQVEDRIKMLAQHLREI